MSPLVVSPGGEGSWGGCGEEIRFILVLFLPLSPPAAFNPMLMCDIPVSSAVGGEADQVA